MKYKKTIYFMTFLAIKMSIGRKQWNVKKNHWKYKENISTALACKNWDFMVFF